MPRLSFTTVLALTAILVLSSSCAKRPEDSAPARQWSAAAGDFVLSAEVVEALEGGPVVIDVKLRYDGQREIDVPFRTYYRGPSFRIDSPEKAWSRKEKPLWLLDGSAWGVSFGSGEGHVSIAPGEELSRVLYFHQGFQGVPSGRVQISLTWDMEERHVGEKMVTGATGAKSFEIVRKLVMPSVSLDLDVPAATPERVQSLARKLNGLLERPSLAPKIEESILNQVLYAKHPEFLPIAFRLLRRNEHHRQASELRYYLHEWSKQSTEVRASLLSYLCEYGDRTDRYCFVSWAREGIPASQEEVNQLMGSKKVWIRAYTYHNWPEKCPEGTKEALLKEMGELRAVLEARAW